jgi:hypothetical protein
MKWLRRFRVRREIQQRLDAIAGTDASIDPQFRAGAYLALRVMREWLDGIDGDVDFKHDAIDHALRLTAASSPGRHVWAYHLGRRVSGPLVSLGDDGSATVYDNRTHQVVTIRPEEVSGADVRACGQERDRG